MNRATAKLISLGLLPDVPAPGETWHHERHGNVKIVEPHEVGYVADILANPGRREPVLGFFLTRCIKYAR